MSSKVKKQSAFRNQRKSLITTGLIIWTCLLVVAAFVLTDGLSSRPNEPANDDAASITDESPYNETTFKEEFLANCQISAKVNLSEAAASEYCNCVLNQGIAEFGIKRFAEMNQEVMQTYDLSQFKDLINECATKATT